MSGVSRFTFDQPDLLGGIKPLLVMVGLFAVSEMLVQISEPPWARADAGNARLKLPDWAMWKRIARPTGIGCVIGTFEGVTPGAGGTVAAFMSYSEARRWSRRPRNSARVRPRAWPRRSRPTTW